MRPPEYDPGLATLTLRVLNRPNQVRIQDQLSWYTGYRCRGIYYAIYYGILWSYHPINFQDVYIYGKGGGVSGNVLPLNLTKKEVEIGKIKKRGNYKDCDRFSKEGIERAMQNW